MRVLFREWERGLLDESCQFTDDLLVGCLYGGGFDNQQQRHYKLAAPTDIYQLTGPFPLVLRSLLLPSVPGTAAAPSPEEKGTTISTGTSATTPSGRGGTRRARKSLREVASDKACEKISGFTHRGGWTGEFLDPEAERKYMEYAAFSNQNSLQQFATTMGIVTTIMLVVRLVVSDTDKIDDNSMVVGWILQVLR